MLDHLVIIAGGKATRLGPITATMSKALVTVGSQPMLIRQIVGLDPKHVTVVVNDETRAQVEALLGRVYPAERWDVVVQPKASGPVDAITVGLKDVEAGLTAILMADSLYDWDVVHERLKNTRDDWVAVTEGDGQPPRSFCWVDSRGRLWEDSADWDDTDYIFTGLVVTKNSRAWRSKASVIAANAREDNEIGMAALLKQMSSPDIIEVPWHDAGDLPALAATTRALFIKRDHHGASLDDLGVLHKTGCSREQVEYMLARSKENHPLFPRVLASDGKGWLSLEYFDVPTLAELWLYWPGTADVWCHIIDRLLDVISTKLWPDQNRTHISLNSDVVHELFIGKMIKRLKELPEDRRPAVNAVTQLVELLEPIVAKPMPALMHGDLNMTNILYSARTDTFKLIDPRGDPVGDLRYDLAKLRYSWHGFVKIVHGIPQTHGDMWNGDGRRPSRELDAIIAKRFPQIHHGDLAAIEASIFWSALPLHPVEQQSSLVSCGYDRLEAAKR